jgi:F-type H+-transporting ATPase subunit delta
VSVVHRTYARSLFQAAKEAGRLAQARQDLGDFVKATRQVPELDELLRNPQLDRRAKVAAVEALTGEADPLVLNFLRLLIEKGRAGEVGQVAEEFERMAAAEEGELSVELTTAYELSDEEAGAIVGQIE